MDYLDYEYVTTQEIIDKLNEVSATAQQLVQSFEQHDVDSLPTGYLPTTLFSTVCAAAEYDRMERGE